jgi:hypothetical protein
LVNRVSQTDVTCAQNWGVEGYQTYDFKVTEADSYTFCYGANTVMFSLFDGAGYVPASPCNNWLQANNWGAIGWTGCFTIALSPCEDYQMVSFAAFGDVTSTIDVTSAGNGSIYATTGGPGANYDYTYAAVNTTTNLISAVSSTSNFTTLNGGNYLIYGASYYNGGGTNPPPANPALWPNQSLSQVLSSGDCVNFSVNSKSVIVTGSVCPPSYSQANGNMLVGVQQVIADYETDGIIESTQTIQLNPGNPGLAVSVDYDSATSIELLPNFEVKLGVVFTSFIDGCGGGL